MNILLVISGGIAAYKSLELIRRLKEKGHRVRAILTKGGAEFITPLSVSALSGEKTYTDLFSLTDEAEMGHIRLSREADLIVVAPASANMIAKMAHGLANDLASTVLLASDKQVLIAPAMNYMMWENPATQDNIEILRKRGIYMVGPCAGDMACGETGVGRLAEVDEILNKIASLLPSRSLSLHGKSALVTAGPTIEPIDPVRYLSNHSSGRQGVAIAEALARAGANVTLVAGPLKVPVPSNIRHVSVKTAEDMLQACLATLPVDIAVCAAAVSDYAPENRLRQKIKKDDGALTLTLKENPDILAQIAQHSTKRPRIVIGFAAETDNLLENAMRKLAKKKCDVIVANNVAGSAVFDDLSNRVEWIRVNEIESWPRLSKTDIAVRITEKIIHIFEEQ